MCIIRAVQNNSGMPDEALLLTCSLGHVSGGLETKNSALEANQASRRGGCFTRGVTRENVKFM